MKIIFKFQLIFIGLSIIGLVFGIESATSDPKIGSPLINRYKDLKNPFGRHSLFLDSNAENISNSITAVPPPIPQK